MWSSPRAWRRRFARCTPAARPRKLAVAAHTAARGSGRVGRSAAGRALADDALALAVAAYVRHRHTRYDELLMSGIDRADARSEIREEMDKVLARWRIL